MIEAVVIGRGGRGECGYSCGLDWSSPETIKAALTEVRERFGDVVSLRYLDIAGPASDAKLKSWQDKIKKDKTDLPVLLMDGEVRVSGGFDIRTLLDSVEVELEMKQVRQ